MAALFPVYGPYPNPGDARVYRSNDKCVIFEREEDAESINCYDTDDSNAVVDHLCYNHPIGLVTVLKSDILRIVKID